MGFNLSGLAINKNYKDDFQGLQEELGWVLREEGEITFEEASSNWKEEGTCDVYFAEQGTLLFISMERCEESWGLKKANTLTFALSETSMVFNLNYCENGVLQRSILEVESNRITEEGEPLEAEESSEDTSEMIWNQLEVVLGEPFWDIELTEKAVRYHFVTEAEQPPKQQTMTEEQPVLQEKEWWQFWK